MKYIDIHSHIIFNVDDGSKNLIESIEALHQLNKIGMTDVVCTPHFCHIKLSKVDLVKKNFLELKKYAKDMGINLYLGNEILYSTKMIELLETKKLLGINKSKYVLFEFKRNENMPINNIVLIVEELKEKGYKPILAHPELYNNYLDIEKIKKIKEAGAMLQIDATSVLRKTRRANRKFANKLLKEKLVDIVASDTHCNKFRNYLSFYKGYKKIKRRYGKEYSQIIFYENPSKILGIKEK